MSYDYIEFKNTYICKVSTNPNIITRETAKITSVSGSHKSGHSNDNVLSFHAFSKTINNFPSGLESIFKNLKVISIESTQLKEVHQSDLKPFPQLEFLCLAQNDIKTLEEDLFEFNSNIKLVMFYSCKITHIDPNVFDHLDKMTYLLLSSNTCIHEEARNDRTKVMKIIKKIQNRQCINPSVKKKEKIIETTTMSTQVSQPEDCSAQKSKFIDFVSNLKSLVDRALNDSEASISSGQCQAFNKTITILNENLENSSKTNENLQTLKDVTLKIDSDVSSMNSMMTITNKKMLTDLSDIAATNNENYGNLNEKIDNLGVKLDNLEGNFNSLLSKIMEISGKFEKIDEIEQKFENLEKNIQKILKAVN